MEFLFLFSQTLTHFHAGVNRLGNESMKYLSIGLKRNRVRSINLYHLTSYNTDSFSQTLQVLNLRGNCIQDEGAEYVANALRGNRVSRLIDMISEEINLTFIDFEQIESWKQ